jgi:hypothetical protein
LAPLPVGIKVESPDSTRGGTMPLDGDGDGIRVFHQGGEVQCANSAEE